MPIRSISAIASRIIRSARRPWLAALACFALAAFSPSVSHSQTATAPAIKSSAAIWFHPQPAFIGPQANGLPDFLPLFQPDAPWPRALAKTRFFGLYAGWISAASPQVLLQVVDFVNAHDMAIEIEAPSLQAQSTCGSGVEGYVPYGQSLATFTLGYLQRLKAFGAKRIVVKVDEPFYFGVVVNDPRSCHFSVQQTAEYVGQYAQLVKTVYPDAEIGDVEPIIDSAYPPGVVAAIAEWHQAYRAVTGEPFPFFFADIEFGSQTWPYLVRQLEQQTHQLGMKFGIIYIGDPSDLTDAEWAAKTIARFYIYQGDSGGQPDYVLFQSWEPHPQYFLPESNPFTFTGVLDSYIDATSPNHD
jgi:hypothetical protein